jgi:hypothetical protein
MSDEPDPALRPGDEAPPDAESSGEVQCPEFGGRGQLGYEMFTAFCLIKKK